MIRFMFQIQLNQIYRINVMIVYMTNFFLNHYENFYVIVLYKSLHFDYKSFNRKLIVEKLLDEMYKTMKI